MFFSELNLSKKNFRLCRRTLRSLFSFAFAAFYLCISFCFFSCKSGDVSFLTDLEQNTEQKKSVTVYGEDIFMPESVSELESGNTTVFFKTDIPKSNIYLNNIYQGKTPLEIKSLLPGYYVLTVEISSRGKSGGRNAKSGGPAENSGGRSEQSGPRSENSGSAESEAGSAEYSVEQKKFLIEVIDGQYQSYLIR